MTSCTRSLDLLDAELTEADRAHVAECPDCSLLLGGADPLRLSPTAQDALPLPPPPSQALEALREQPRATSWKRPLWILVAVQLAVLLGAGVFFSVRSPQPANTASPGVVVTLGALILAHVAVSGWLAFRPRWRVGTGFMMAVSGAALTAGILWGGSGLELRSVGDGILHCVGVMVALSVLPLVAAVMSLRDIGSHPGRAFAAGLSAAGVGVLLLHVICPEGTGAHLLFGHVAPWVLLAGALIWMRGRVTTRSHAP